MFLQITVNPTHFQEAIDMFYHFLISCRGIFPFGLLCAKVREKKSGKVWFLVTNHLTLCIFQSDKVFSRKSKQAENIWMKYRWRQKEGGGWRRSASATGAPKTAHNGTKYPLSCLQFLGLFYFWFFFSCWASSGQYNFSFLLNSFNLFIKSDKSHVGSEEKF